ncbi:glycoside hydrolase family 43 protein [Sphingobacterium bovistauri]|uniref:Family 43 glycosylhydrolase n=1 Tax=Sphingobacterium bovistauri TaxID=2781959 RepID=A0ABS7Z364_9SPHI|nr:glycoside hydrolase family 43 protein [Sphingobacterium bovistauri]MCA5004628.1 family 43 glycosylhydrolase [Sphingobacterium bovistauri]
MRLKKIFIVNFLIGILSLCTVFLYAQNPIIQTKFTADPASLVYDGRFYVFAGRDEASEAGKWFNMKEWRIFSSADMVNWTDHGPRLKALDFSWANADAWASQCIEHNGKFYWYVSVNHKEIKGKAIGVAVSDNVLGPYVDVRGSAIITNDMTPNGGDFDDIDPSVYVDEDGQAYLFWGNGKCKYVKLNADMISFSGEIMDVAVPKFGEAPWIHKRNGIYYLSYSSSLPSTIEYCTSKSIHGPWEYKGRLLETVENCATSHQAISLFKDRWYFVYHNGKLETGGNHRRSVCIEELKYNEDGTISKLTSSSLGIHNAMNTINPYSKIEAETIALSSGVQTVDYDNSTVCITGINNNDFILIKNVDFGKIGATKFKASVSSEDDLGAIEIRLGKPGGELIGVYKIPNTGSFKKFQEKVINHKKIVGVHDLYFMFKGSSSNNLFDFDYWVFEQ